MRQVGKVWVLITSVFLAGLATWVLAATWPRDDTGVPAPVVSFLGSGGRPTLVSATDPLPVNTGLTTTSSTDPSGWGRSWVVSQITFPSNVDNDLAVVRELRTGSYLVYASHVPTTGYRSTLGTNFTSAFTTSSVPSAHYAIDANPSLGVYVSILPSTTTTDGARSSDGITWTLFTLPTPSGFVGNPVPRWVVASQGTTILIAIQDDAAGSGVSVCRSTDGAASWTCAPASAFPGSAGLHNATTETLNTHQVLASAGPGRWLLVDRVGHVYRSTDDGVTWAFVTTLITNPLATSRWAVACPAIDTCVVSITSIPGQRTFRSTDGGQTWTELTANKPTTTITHWVVFGAGILVGLSNPNENTAWWSNDNGASFIPLGTFIPNNACGSGYWRSVTDGQGTAVVGLACETGTERRVLVSRPVSAQDRRITDDQGRILRVRPDGSLDVNILNPTTTVTANQGTALGLSSINHPWPVVPVQRNQALSNQAVIGSPNTEVVVSVAGASSELVWWYSIVAQCNAPPTATPVDLTITGFNSVKWRYRGVTEQPVFIQFNPPFTDGIAATGDHSVRLSPCGTGISGLLSVQASRF